MVGSGISQTGDFSVPLTNVSRSWCWLHGYPPFVTAFTRSGRIRHLHLPHLAAVTGVIDVPIAPGQRAFLAIDTGSACVPRGSRQPTRYSTLRIGLPGGGSVGSHTGSGGIIFVCGLGVHPFGEPEATPDIAGTFDGLTVTIHAPTSVRAGQTLTYSVALRNLTRQPVPLSSCPSYRELVATAGSTVTAQQSYQLNCDDIRQIPALSQVIYEMLIHIPPALLPGPAKFTWSFTNGPPSTAGNVTIQSAG